MISTGLLPFRWFWINSIMIIKKRTSTLCLQFKNFYIFTREFENIHRNSNPDLPFSTTQPESSESLATCLQLIFFCGLLAEMVYGSFLPTPFIKLTKIRIHVDVCMSNQTYDHSNHPLPLPRVILPQTKPALPASWEY